MEFAQAAQGAGPAGDPRGRDRRGRRRRPTRPRGISRCSCATRRAGATSAGCSRARTRTRATRRRGPAGRARHRTSRIAGAAGHAGRRRGPRRGAGLPERLRPPRRARRADDAPAAATPSGATRFRVELQRPFPRHDRALNRGLGVAGRRLGVPSVATGDVHAHTPPRARCCRTRSSPSASTRRSTPPSRCAAATTATSSRRPQAMAARFADHPDAVAETARLAETLRFDLTQDLGYRYPGAEDGERRPRAWPRCAARCFDDALPARPPAARRGAPRAWRRSCALIAPPRAVGLLPAAPRHARARARGGRRGPRRRRGRARCCRPGAGGGPRCRRSSATSPGLSHVDPIANKLAARALPQRGDHVAARHRPRLPARRARGADPARARALRARPRRRSSPPSRPTARAGRSARSARRSGCRRGRSSASRAARRAGARRTSTRTSTIALGEGRERQRALAAGWPTCRARPTGCRATSPSTRAG